MTQEKKGAKQNEVDNKNIKRNDPAGIVRNGAIWWRRVRA